MSNRLTVRISPVYCPHWLAYWRLAAATILLFVLGLGCLFVFVPVALLLLGFATGGAVSTCLYRTWHRYYFLESRRLVYQHGFLGRHIEVINLFGRVTHSQMPFLGKLLNVGNVHLGVVGPDLNMRHISQFDDFRRFLMESN